MAGTNTAPAPDLILVTHCVIITIAMFRVVESFWNALIRYWSMGNFRADGLGAVLSQRIARDGPVILGSRALGLFGRG